MPQNWRKAARSQNGQNCVEVAWRKASRSQNGANCVELGARGGELSSGALRDSKNPGPTLTADIPTLIAAVKRL